jgi:hypothetical protein
MRHGNMPNGRMTVLLVWISTLESLQQEELLTNFTLSWAWQDSVRWACQNPVVYIYMYVYERLVKTSAHVLFLMVLWTVILPTALASLLFFFNHLTANACHLFYIIGRGETEFLVTFTTHRWQLREVEHSVEWELGEETKVFREDLSQCPFLPTKNLWTDLRFNLGCHSGTLVTNFLSYGMA